MNVVGKEKVSWMKLTTEPLDNEKNYRKVKKAFRSLPQIHDQLFDDNSKETVTIKVVCCSPEKVAEKLWKKGRGVIKKIEYDIDNPFEPKSMGPQEPNEAENPKEAEKPEPPPQAASSSQTMTHYWHPPVSHAVYEGYNDYNQQYGNYSDSVPLMAEPMSNGYPSRPIHDSYGGGGGWYAEESSYCTIM